MDLKTTKLCLVAENPFTTTSLSRTSTAWEIGPSRIQQCRKLAFFDLWRRGFFLTDGSKFGADFLTYPGDPIRGVPLMTSKLRGGGLVEMQTT